MYGQRLQMPIGRGRRSLQAIQNKLESCLRFLSGFRGSFRGVHSGARLAGKHFAIAGRSGKASRHARCGFGGA